MTNFFVTGPQGGNAGNAGQPQSQVFTTLVPAPVGAGVSGGGRGGRNNPNMTASLGGHTPNDIAEKPFNIDLQSLIAQSGLNPGGGTISLPLGPRREATEVPRAYFESSVFNQRIKDPSIISLGQIGDASFETEPSVMVERLRVQQERQLYTLNVSYSTTVAQANVNSLVSYAGMVQIENEWRNMQNMRGAINRIRETFSGGHITREHVLQLCGFTSKDSLAVLDPALAKDPILVSHSMKKLETYERVRREYRLKELDAEYNTLNKTSKAGKENRTLHKAVTTGKFELDRGFYTDEVVDYVTLPGLQRLTQLSNYCASRLKESVPFDPRDGSVLDRPRIMDAKNRALAFEESFHRIVHWREWIEDPSISFKVKAKLVTDFEASSYDDVFHVSSVINAHSQVERAEAMIECMKAKLRLEELGGGRSSVMTSLKESAAVFRESMTSPTTGKNIFSQLWTAIRLAKDKYSECGSTVFGLVDRQVPWWLNPNLMKTLGVVAGVVGAIVAFKLIPILAVKFLLMTPAVAIGKPVVLLPFLGKFGVFHFGVAKLMAGGASLVVVKWALDAVYAGLISYEEKKRLEPAKASTAKGAYFLVGAVTDNILSFLRDEVKAAAPRPKVPYNWKECIQEVSRIPNSTVGDPLLYDIEPTTGLPNAIRKEGKIDLRTRYFVIKPEVRARLEQEMSSGDTGSALQNMQDIVDAYNDIDRIYNLAQLSVDRVIAPTMVGGKSGTSQKPREFLKPDPKDLAKYPNGSSDPAYIRAESIYLERCSRGGLAEQMKIVVQNLSIVQKEQLVESLYKLGKALGLEFSDIVLDHHSDKLFKLTPPAMIMHEGKLRKTYLNIFAPAMCMTISSLNNPKYKPKWDTLKRAEGIGKWLPHFGTKGEEKYDTGIMADALVRARYADDARENWDQVGAKPEMKKAAEMNARENLLKAIAEAGGGGAEGYKHAMGMFVSLDFKYIAAAHQFFSKAPFSWFGLS